MVNTMIDVEPCLRIQVTRHPAHDVQRERPVERHNVARREARVSDDHVDG